MELTKKQQEFLASNKRYKFANWGRRSGKTTMFAYEALGTALSKKARVTYYAPTISDARDISWGMFQEVFGDAIVKKNESLLELTVRNIHGGTSIVALRGWESVVTGEKGRGVENDLLIFDEVAFCRNFKSYWYKTLEPTLLTSKGRAVFASTPDGFNHWYEMCNEAQSNDGYFYSHATSYDNPFNDPVDLERIKKERTEDAFAQEYLADFRKQEGLVYKEFSRERHTYLDADIDVAEEIAGIDFGFTNPTAVLSIVRDRNNVYWVTEEWYKTGKTHEQVAEYVAQQQYNKVYPDPASPEAIKILENKHVNVYEVSKGKDSIITGIQRVRDLFKQNRLKIHVSCENLIWELETYAYPEKRAYNNEEEVPIKENDHALDALRYAIMSNIPVDYEKKQEYSRKVFLKRMSNKNRAL